MHRNLQRFDLHHHPHAQRASQPGIHVFPRCGHSDFFHQHLCDYLPGDSHIHVRMEYSDEHIRICINCHNGDYRNSNSVSILLSSRSSLDDIAGWRNDDYGIYNRVHDHMSGD